MCDCLLSRFPIKYLLSFKENEKQVQMFVSEEKYKEINKLMEENPGAKL